MMDHMGVTGSMKNSETAASEAAMIPTILPQVLPCSAAMPPKRRRAPTSSHQMAIPVMSTSMVALVAEEEPLVTEEADDPREELEGTHDHHEDRTERDSEIPLPPFPHVLLSQGICFDPIHIHHLGISTQGRILLLCRLGWRNIHSGHDGWAYSARTNRHEGARLTESQQSCSTCDYWEHRPVQADGTCSAIRRCPIPRARCAKTPRSTASTYGPPARSGAVNGGPGVTCRRKSRRDTTRRAQIAAPSWMRTPMPGYAGSTPWRRSAPSS